MGHVVLFTQSTWGLIVCIFLPLGGFVAYEIIRRKKQDAAKQSNIDTLMEELKALKEAQAMQAQPQEPAQLPVDESISTEDPTPTVPLEEPSDSNLDG
jgi:hypothetical protein